MFVTSPNMEVALVPVTESRVTMRQNNTFGKDDPLIWPQKFNRLVAHLAVIPAPYSPVPLEMQSAWYLPQSQDFIEEQIESIEGLWKLSAGIVHSLKLMSTFLEGGVEQLPKDERVGVLLHLLMSVQSLNDQLPISSTKPRLELLVAFFQRVCLELYARIQWVIKWRPREGDMNKHQADVNVIGAFTDEMKTAQFLFSLGIPVWLIREIRQVETTRVEKVVRLLDSSLEANREYLPLRNRSERIDISQAQPPHPYVYTGIPGSFNRYTAMGKYIQSQFESNLLGDFSDTTPPTSQNPEQPSSSTTKKSARKGQPQPPKSDQKGTLEYDLLHLDPRTSDAPILTKRNPSVDPGLNKFIEIYSPYVPPLLYPWRLAQDSLKEFWPHLSKPELYFVVPDVMLFFNPQGEPRLELLLMWLRIRPLVMWRLTSTGANNVPIYPSSSWRAMFETMEGTNSKDTSKKGKKRKLMSVGLEELAEQARRAGVTLDQSNLGLATPRWGNNTVTVHNLTPRVMEEILWELNEIAFRFELLNLNMRLGRRATGAEQENYWEGNQNIVLNCWPGYIFTPTLANPGLSKNTQIPPNTITGREQYLSSLFRVMQHWREPKPYELERAFPTAQGKSVADYESELLFLEGIMATFYARLFLKTFHRPATLPRGLNINM